MGQLTLAFAPSAASRPGVPTGVVHRGDNLSILRGLPDGYIDLIYLDPPFNSGRTHAAVDRKTGETHSFGDTFKSIEAYIAFMRPRCEEMRRVLAPHGSLYLHCDDSAGAYLGIMLDGVFGADRLVNDIKWVRSGPKGNPKRWGRCHDSILFYSRSADYVFNPPDSAIGDLWDDIPPINAGSKERTGYPTQKPVALLERIVRASSDPGAVVLDPFCGSGTALAAAENLGRRWIGIDQSEGACRAARRRMGIDDIPMGAAS